MRLAVFYAVFEVIVFSVNPFCEITVHYVKRNTQIAQYAYQMLPPYRKLQRQESSNQTFLIKESTNLESTVVPRAAVLFLILIVKKKM